MNNTEQQPEPLAAILAEIRERAAEERDCGWNGEADDLLAWADRIEAAAKREREAAQSARDEDDETVDIDSIMTDPDYLPGDVAIAVGL